MLLAVKNLPVIAGDTRDMGSIPESERSPGEGNGNLLQYSCPENPMDRGVWWGTVHGARVGHDRPQMKSLTQVEQRIYRRKRIRLASDFLTAVLETRAWVYSDH